MKHTNQLLTRREATAQRCLHTADIARQLLVVVTVGTTGCSTSMVTHVEQGQLELLQQWLPEHPIAIDGKTIAMRDQQTRPLANAIAPHLQRHTVTQTDIKALLWLG